MQTRDLLASLISINSAYPEESPDPTRPGEIAVAEFIELLLRERGFMVQRQPVVGNRFLLPLHKRLTKE